MSLLRFEKVTIHFGGSDLLREVGFSLGANERIGLVGRNGSGKSTFLNLAAGTLMPDEGLVKIDAAITLSKLDQETPEEIQGSIHEVVAGGLSGQTSKPPDAKAAGAQTREGDDRVRSPAESRALDHHWETEKRIDKTFSHFGLPAPEIEFRQLSGGLQRRVLLARALVAEPDILLLDEPTNHLDLETIHWLESMLEKFRGSLLFVSHDRRFLQKLAGRIVELDRGSLYSYPGDYDRFVQQQAHRLRVESEQQNTFDRKLGKEEAWIRQGIKARRTRNEGRVRALATMRQQRQQRVLRDGQAKLHLQQSPASGRLVIELDRISVRRGHGLLIDDFSSRIIRGDKVGIVGSNGSGKSTLLQTLLGELQPEKGSVILGSKLHIASFDQQRSAINDSQTVEDNVAQGRSTVTVNGRSRHIVSYLQDFLFSPQRIRTPAGALSGGEKARLLLARLFTQPANLLVLDEPTNDLDLETLELLESLLVGFSGTLLVVSHDRFFLDNVVTSIIALEGEGKLREYVGGYSDWQRQKPEAPAAKVLNQKKSKSQQSKPLPQKLSYKDQRLLSELPRAIETLEQELLGLQASMNDPGFYQRPAEELSACHRRHEALEIDLEAKYRQWETLEQKKLQLQNSQ